MTEITRILTAIDQGDARAADELLPLVYEQLRLLAAQKLSQEKPGQTLQATALVHEAYLRLVGLEEQHWDSRGHFFAAAAEAMRRILVENVRRKQRVIHGGEWQRLHPARFDPSDKDWGCDDESQQLIALDQAVTRLAAEDSAKAEVVKLRYFAGLTIEQTASALGISHATVERYWAYARAWLLKEVSGGEISDGS
jgi:RNA polymerase sigma factor (TIGR02999 family)